MVAGRVHLRLGQGRGAVPVPHPSLLETSIPSIAPAACLGIFHWWARGPPAGRPGPLPSRPGHTCGCAGAACLQRTLTHSLWLSAQSHDSASARASFRASSSTASLLCMPIPCHSMPRLGPHTVTHTWKKFFYWYCSAAAEKLHRAEGLQLQLFSSCM